MATTELSLTKPYETVDVSINYASLPTFVDSGVGGLTGYDWKYYYFDAGVNCEAQRFIFDVHFTGAAGDKLYFRKLGYSASNDISTVINAIKANSSSYLSTETYFSNGTRAFNGDWPTSAFRYYWVLFREPVPLTNVTVSLTYTKCVGTYRGAVLGTMDYLDGQLSYGLFYPLNYNHNDKSVRHPIIINLPGQIVATAAGSIYQITASIARNNEAWDAKYNCFGISFHWADCDAYGRGDTTQIAPTTLLPTYNKLLGDYNTPKNGAREGTWHVSGIYKTIKYLINRFNIDEDRIYLAGYSWGGIVAYEFAKQFPSVLAGMIVADAGFFPNYWTTDPYVDKFTSPASVAGQDIYPYFQNEIKRIKHIPMMFSALRHGYTEIQMLRIHDEVIRQGGESHYVFNDHNSAMLKEWRLNNTDTLFVGDGKSLTITIGASSFVVTFVNGTNYSLTSISTLINAASSAAGLGSVSVQGNSGNATYVPADPIKGTPAKYGLIVRHPSYTTAPNYYATISITTDPTATYYNFLGTNQWYIKNGQDYTEYGTSSAVDFFPLTTNVRWVGGLRSDHDYGMSNITREQYLDWLFSNNRQNNIDLLYSPHPIADETYSGGIARKHLGPGLDIPLTTSDKIKYTGLEDAVVKINNTDYIISEENDSFVWDKGGVGEYVFSTVGEDIFVSNSSGNFKVTYQGEGSYLFDIDFLNTYYVDKNSIGGEASDSNPGTITSPWKTLKHAWTTAESGDVVYVRTGTYYESLNSGTNAGTESNPIVFAPYNNEKVVINPGLRFDDWEPYSAYGNIWYRTFPADNESVEHISFDLINGYEQTEICAIKRAGISGDPNSGFGITPYNFAGESYQNDLEGFINFVEGNEVISNDGYNLNTSDYDWIYTDVENRTVYIKLANGDPNTDIYMLDNARRICVTKPFIEINGFTIQYSFEGIKGMSEGNPINYPSDLHIINNTIRYIYGQGILVGGLESHNLLIDNNTISYTGRIFSVNGSGNWFADNQMHSIYISVGDNAIISNNHMTYSTGQSLHPWGLVGTTDYYAANNNLKIYNNYVEGGYVGNGSNIKIYNNIIKNSSISYRQKSITFVFYPVDGCEVYYNTISGINGVYLGISDNGQICRNIIFKNNIVRSTNDYSYGTFYLNLNSVDMSTCDFDYNSYYGGSSNQNGVFIKYEGTSQTTVGNLTAWKNFLDDYTQPYGNGYEYNSISGDQLLDSNYRITGSSPVLGKAVAISAGNNGSTISVTTDMYGSVRSSNIDIGAYEYQSPSTTYYVDTNSIGGPAHDSNTGTLISPWKTFNYAWTNANAGDTVYVREGTYYEGTYDNCLDTKDGTSVNPIVFDTYNGEEVIINPGLMFDDWEAYDEYGSIWYRTFVDGDDITFGNTWSSWQVGAIKRAGIDGDSNSGFGINLYSASFLSPSPLGTLSDFISFVERNEVVTQGVNSLNTIDFDWIFVDVPGDYGAAKTVYIKLANGNPNTDVYIIDYSKSLPVLKEYREINNLIIQYAKFAYSGNNSNNLQIKNNVIRYSEMQGIYISPGVNNVLIDNNSIYNTGRPFKYVYSESGVDWQLNNQDHGIYFSGDQDGIISNNRITNSMGHSLHPWATADPYYYPYSINLKIYNNYVEGGFVANGTNIRVYNNIFLESALPQYIGNSYIFSLYPTNGCEIYYNLIKGKYCCYFGYAPNNGEINENIKFKNNIVTGDEPVLMYVNFSGVDLTTFDFDYNIYDSSGHFYASNKSPTLIDSAGHLTNWQSYLTTAGAIGHDHNSSSNDPLLDNYNRIKYNSVCRNAATTITSGTNGATITITTDMYGNTR